jgi:hypothetical protein
VNTATSYAASFFTDAQCQTRVSGTAASSYTSGQCQNSNLGAPVGAVTFSDLGSRGIGMSLGCDINCIQCTNAAVGQLNTCAAVPVLPGAASGTTLYVRVSAPRKNTLVKAVCFLSAFLPLGLIG